VIAIFAVTVLVLASPLATGLYRMWRAAPDGPRQGVAGGGKESAPAPSSSYAFPISRVVGPGLWCLAIIGFAAAFWSATGWRFSARLMPQTAAAAGLIVIAGAGIGALVARLRRQPMFTAKTAFEVAGTFGGLPETTVYARLLVEMLWLAGLLGGVLLIGLMPAMGFYMFLYMATAGRTRWPMALLITVSLWIGFYMLFVKLLHVPWPPSLLGDAFPDLREWTGRLM
jgi:hypothetical protein